MLLACVTFTMLKLRGKTLFTLNAAQPWRPQRKAPQPSQSSKFEKNRSGPGFEPETTALPRAAALPAEITGRLWAFGRERSATLLEEYGTTC